MKKPIVVSLILIAAILAVWLVLRKRNQPSELEPVTGEPAQPEPATSQPRPSGPVSYPSGGGRTIPGNRPSAPPPAQPAQPVASGFDAMKQMVEIAILLNDPFDLANQDDKAFTRLLAFSDNQLKAVAQAWPANYKKIGGPIRPSLREQVADEIVWSSRNDVAAKKQKVLERLTKIGM